MGWEQLLQMKKAAEEEAEAEPKEESTEAPAEEETSEEAA